MYEREYAVCEVNNKGEVIGTLQSGFLTYKEAYQWGLDNVTHDRWTVVRRK